MAANQDEKQMYEDLVGFLLSERVDLRIKATEAVLQIRDPEGMEKLVNHGLVKSLARNFNHPNPTVGVNALNGVVGLSSQGTNACIQQCLEELMLAGGINRVSEVILSSSPAPDTKPDQPAEEGSDSPWDTWRKKVNFALAILANLTRSEEGAVELVGKTLPEKAVASQQLTEEEKEKLPTKPLLELMLSRFLRLDFGEEEVPLTGDSDGVSNDGAKTMLALANAPHEALQDSNFKDPYQHFAAVLMNCTQTEAARKFVLKIRRKHDNDANPTSVFQAILPQLRTKNPIRRRGIAGVLRNCCLEKEAAWWFLNIVKLTKHLLYPLAGPEELDLDDKKGLDPDVWLEGPDKVREPDTATRLSLVECILLLCATGRKSRESLRLERVYVVLKVADMVEEEEEVSERINECVQFLRRDEEGTFDGSSDLMVEESLSRPKSSVQISMVHNEDDDYDAVD